MKWLNWLLRRKAVAAQAPAPVVKPVVTAAHIVEAAQARREARETRDADNRGRAVKARASVVLREIERRRKLREAQEQRERHEAATAARQAQGER